MSIAQPYASLIALPATDPRHKRVENRTWVTKHRGPVAICASKSMKWIEPHDRRGPGFEKFGFEIAALPLGAVVAVANLCGCIDLADGHVAAEDLRRWPWLEFQQLHLFGPRCFLLEAVKALPTPVPVKGMLYLFELPADVERLVTAQL